MATFTRSSKTNPCPVCDRTKDGDCRILDSGMVLCHTTLNGVAPGKPHPDRPFIYCGQSDEAQGFGKWLPEHLASEPLAKAPREPLEHRFNYQLWDGSPAPKQRLRIDYSDGRPKKVTWAGKLGIPESEIAPFGWHEAMDSLGFSDDPLFIVKGELKAKQLTALGHCSISILGVSERLIAELRQLGRQVVLAPDCDLADLQKWYRELTQALPQCRHLLVPMKGLNWRQPPEHGGLGIEDWLQTSTPSSAVVLAAITGEPWQPLADLSDTDADIDDLPLAQRIDIRVQEVLAAQIANSPSALDAAFSELYRLGVSRERVQERALMLWAEQHGLDISTGSTPQSTVRGRVIGQAKSGAGLRQQIPGFGLDKDLHLVVSDAAGGKTTAFCELVTTYTARDRGFLDHEAPRTDPDDDPRATALVIASDGEGSAYSMWEDYLDSVNAVDRGAKVEIWAQDDDTGESAWNVSIHNLERLVKRLEEGDVVVVVMDTANAVFRGAGVNTGVGPIETYLRLLKQIVCRHCSLWISHHTNRGGGTTMKAIGGHPAFQEVPSVIHLIEVRDQADGTKLRVWHVLKLRGSNYRRFSYELANGELKVTDGHFYENCREQLLVLIHRQQTSGGFTSPGDLINLSRRPSQSVYQALNELRSLKLIRPRGRGYRLTAEGERTVQRLRVAVESDGSDKEDAST